MTKLPFEQVSTVKSFLKLQRSKVESGHFDRMTRKQRRAFVLASLVACEKSLEIVSEFMNVLQKVQDAADAAEPEVPPI